MVQGKSSAAHAKETVNGGSGRWLGKRRGADLVVHDVGPDDLDRRGAGRARRRGRVARVAVAPPEREER